MKKILSTILVAVLICSVIPCAYADSSEENFGAIYSQNEGTVEPRAEQTDWFFRYNSELGRYEKRLWSYTYGVWLTEWIPC